MQGSSISQAQKHDHIELWPTSIEKENFPKIAAESKLLAMVLPGF